MYREYWIAWGVLLTLTILMVGLDRAPLPRGAFLLLVLSAMAVKASIIAAYFMHLRFERLPLVLGIVIGLPVNAAILYFLILPDAIRIFRMLMQY
jgi:cytochrome c oxidase subunit IV